MGCPPIFELLPEALGRIVQLALQQMAKNTLQLWLDPGMGDKAMRGRPGGGGGGGGGKRKKYGTKPTKKNLLFLTFLHLPLLSLS